MCSKFLGIPPPRAGDSFFIDKMPLETSTGKLRMFATAAADSYSSQRQFLAAGIVTEQKPRKQYANFTTRSFMAGEILFGGVRLSVVPVPSALVLLVCFFRIRPNVAKCKQYGSQSEPHPDAI